MRLNIQLKDLPLVAFDTETSGAYPVSSEICEIAAVKYQDGQVVEEFQSLVKPTRPMSDFIIGIHGITNEMVASAPSISEVTPKFHAFIQGCAVVGHHVAFDLGFMAYEFEKLSLQFPAEPALCSSLLSQRTFLESPNHKLQTLVEYLGLPKGVAHRALDDTKACLALTLKIFERFGMHRTLEELIHFQESRLDWPRFSIHNLENSEVGQILIWGVRNSSRIEISYRTERDHRMVWPLGVVRNPKGDYLVAYEGSVMPVGPEAQHKRFYLDKIKKARRL